MLNARNAGRIPQTKGSSCVLVLAAALLLAAPVRAEDPLSGASRDLRRSAQTGAGLLARSASRSLNGALAQTSASSFASASFKLDAGYIPLSSQPGTITSIVAATKSTDTLELSWTAPGADGFLGDVTAGFYRIDSSSDPAHVFSPGTFLTEFSTSVRPGELQTWTLSGLLPNTTYYTRVYLADARKFPAERSAVNEDPTLAHPPASPALSGVFSTSVTFTWNLPVRGAEGYRLEGSSTDFGALLPGGIVSSSMTRDGLAVSMTIEDLDFDTTYYFKLGSLNWRDDLNFATLITTRTGPIPPVESLSLLGTPIAHRVRFSWTNPVPARLSDGVLVVVSTAPIGFLAQKGASYAAGDTLADGSLVADAAAPLSYIQGGLELDTTYYYRFFNKAKTLSYSVAVSTQVMLDLPPMAPAGLSASVSADRTTLTMSWTGVTASLDGSGFRAAAAPTSVELTHFDVYRATGIARSNWVWVASAPASAMGCALEIPDPLNVYYYKAVAKDAFGDTDRSMVVDTDRNLYAVGPDLITRLKVPASASGSLLAGGNEFGQSIVIRAAESPEEVGGKVVKSVRFDATLANSGLPAERFQLSRPELEIALRYEMEGGRVVASPRPSDAGEGAQATLDHAVGADEVSQWLSPYWFDGREYIKLYGAVSPGDQTVRVSAAMPGAYQIRSVYHPSQFSMGLNEVSNKVITPNGDRLNDFVVFRLNNPQDSAVSGKIYDMRGAFVADMVPGTQVADSLTWDGRSGGRVVPRGVYIYQIKSENKVFNGTVVVIR